MARARVRKSESEPPEHKTLGQIAEEIFAALGAVPRQERIEDERTHCSTRGYDVDPG
jgi:hypothetical protein